MTGRYDGVEGLELFDGTARLFPLPGTVLFPHVMQPLHIFEPRYRAMVADALEGDRLIAMALLKPGWERDYEGRPEVHSMVCLGRIAAHTGLADGRYNIVLHGAARARVIDEPATDLLYRTAEVILETDHYPAGGEERREVLRLDLLGCFRQLFPRIPEANRQFSRLLEQPLPLGLLTDVLAYALELDVGLKQSLLEELNVERRASALVAQLRAALSRRAVAEKAGFPPRFSAN